MELDGDTKTMLSLISKIGDKVGMHNELLPCKSGKKLEVLEGDPLIQQTVNAIVDLSRFRLSIIVNYLTNLLENISQSSSTTLEEFVPIEILQSQLFILKIMSASMTHHWKCHRGQRDIEAMAQVPHSSPELPPISPASTGSEDSSISSPSQPNLNNALPRSEQRQFRPPKSWDDPPPLDESLAVYILNVLSRFLHQMANQEENNPNLQQNGGQNTNGNNQNSAQYLATYEIVCEIYKNAGRVIFYISASNWNVVFSKIKSRINYLTTTNDEWPETSELKLLEVSDLNSKRLSMVLQELCNTFMHLRRTAQVTMAIVLRKAIWNWIEVFPAEFVKLCQYQERMEGGPERLFDMCNNSADSKGRKAAFWPLQIMLLILCPDILLNSMDKTINANKKDLWSARPTPRAQFLDNLKRHLRGRNLADVAAICYVDICKASTYVNSHDSSTLRTIIPDIESELRHKLFDPDKPFPSSDNVDQQLMTDCLIALFKLNPKETLSTLVPICLRENAPGAFKLVLVKSCNTIASEEDRLPWNPQISSMHSKLASPLRKLFQDLLENRNKVKSKKATTENSEIILNLLKLYRSDPKLAIVGKDVKEQTSENQSIILGIAEYLNDSNSLIKISAAEALMELHKIDLIGLWGTPLQNFWIISSQITLTVATQILEKEKDEGPKYMLDLLCNLLFRRNDFLRSQKDKPLRCNNVPDRLTSNIKLETACLVLLCSSDSEICSMALECINLMYLEALLTTESFANDMEATELPPPQMTIVENIQVYQELAHNQGVFAGRMAQQRRIRKLLRMMVQPTPGNLGAWEEAWDRWKTLTQIIAKPVEDPVPGPIIARRPIMFFSPGSPLKSQNSAITSGLSDEESMEWNHYTRFLAALGGCCVQDRFINASRRTSMPHPNDYHSMVEKYIQEMVDLLVCDSNYVRENVKDTLGNDLSPRLYVILFHHLESIVSRFLDSANPNERFTLFVDQAIHVLKLILERIHDASDNLYACDLGGLVLSFARYLNRLGAGNNALKIKKRMCQLAETLMIKKEYVSLRQEIKLRNLLLEIIIEWTSDFSMKTDSSSVSENMSSKNERLHRDLDSACLKTIVELLLQLPLQPSENAHEADLSQVKSQLFFKYFTFFIKLLSRCRILEAIDSGTHSAKNNQDLQMLLSKSKEYVKDLGPLKDYTIIALSNLLSANVDSGLKYSLSMGYHEDTKTRTAFMLVLRNILHRGTEFEGLGENAVKDRYERLVEVITSSDLEIALSLCEVYQGPDAEEFVRVMAAVFESRDRFLELLEKIFDKEIKNTVYENDVFRHTTMATRLLAAFVKSQGAEYLRETLQPVVNEILSKPSNFSVEINPDRIPPGENIDQNLSNLKSVTKSFLNAIFSSTENMPRSFKIFCYNIAKTIEEKYPGKSLTTIGSFIFLRFFSPAIASPDSENICKPIENIRFRQIFLSSARQLPISTPSSELKLGETTAAARVLDDTDNKALHRHLYHNQEKMGRDLQTRRLMYGLAGNLDNEQAIKQAWDKISTLLAQLGPPPETSKKEIMSVTSQSFANNNHFFQEFMRRNINRATEPIVSKEIFYEGGPSKARRPVFYYIARRLEAEATDMELLMYHVLHTIKSHMSRPFEILVDLTQFGASNEIQSQWVQHFTQILPYEVVENLSKLYLYNTNTAFKKFVKKISRSLPQQISKRTVFCCSLNELHEYIAPSEVRLPRSTSCLDVRRNRNTFSVTRISHYRVHVSVTIKICNEYVQIITQKRQDLINGLSCQLNDVYHISEVEDVNNSRKNDEFEFFIKPDRGRPSLSFTSPKRDAIIQAIRSSKARYQITKPATITERVIRPNGVPGTLLNMALLNIGSEDPNLRSAAYNLLVSLSLIFNFDVGNQLLSAKGLCIPANNSTFVVQMSTRLASTETYLTLEFLSDFFDGFYRSSPAQKHLCLQYMNPWLQNLAFFCRNVSENQTNVKNTRDIIKKLIDMTTKETELYTAIQANVWNKLKQVDEITNIIIDEFIKYAVDHGISSSQAETVANTIVTLSSVNVRGKIVSRLRSAILRTSSAKTKTLTDNPAWTEIAVLIRFNLMLSFNNNIQLYLPELFHIISLLVATGPPLIRASVHGLIVNLVQSLCTSQQLGEENYKRLTLLLTELSDPNFHYFFGLNQSVNSAFSISPESTRNSSETMPLSSLETVIQALLEVIICGAPSTDTSNAWRARWMGLVASTAFQYNPSIQPRAFVALGCLAREEVDDDLLYQILVTLKTALNAFSETDCSLIVSIVMCLTKIVENLTENSKYLRQMFWLAMALIQIGHIPIFPSAVHLLLTVLRSFDAHNFFAEKDIATVLLSYREPLKELAEEMDKENGINYNHFSFAVAAALLKGLKNTTTKTSTVTVLKLFLEITFKGLETREQNIIHASMLGYLAACLPASAKTADMKELLWLCGVFNSELENTELATTYYPIMDRLDIPDNQTALLLISLMVTLLQNADSESERVFLYGFLAEASITVPEVFALVYDVLQPKMRQIVENSSSLSILDAVQQILITVVSEPQYMRTRGDHMSYLEEIGFKHLMDSGSFQPVTKEKMKVNAKLASKLVGCMIIIK
ncbi:5054_t:CDS:10 [Acaulospora morrowiae]|uniref:5054_t:CDS:1 n=1 Tax=Acaulospora morrowiae TaxID=94023 RepID=A0A9N8YMQ0_9GLOM|nr:5054_t:CDS:10 [Acaulospora morrowiae]